MNARGRGWAALGGLFDEQSVLHRKIERLRQPSANRNRLNAKIGATNVTLIDQIIGDGFGGIDGNREADARRCAARRKDRGIDAYDLAVSVDQRTAGIAAIDGGVGLNGFIDECGFAGLHGATKRADHTGGQR